MKLLIPDTFEGPLELPADMQDVEVVTYAASTPVPDEHLDAEALVVWGNASGTLAGLGDRMPNLRWVQSLAAGDDLILSGGFAPNVVLTGGVGLHNRTVTEHALALMLALVRRLPQAARSQSERVWDPRLGGVQPLHPDGPVTTLLDARVLIWGFGGIAQTLAPILISLGAQVRGVARSAGTRAGVEVVADVDAALPDADILVMILPSGAATDGALSAERMTALPDHAYVVNVGRGNSVDESALVAALSEGRLAGAGLDVTAVEPLPADSPLWTAPNLLITPHGAGGRPVGGGERIAANLAALRAGTELSHVVSR